MPKVNENPGELRRQGAERIPKGSLFGEREKKLCSLLESLWDAIMITDEGGYIVFINSKAGMLFGYTRDVLMGWQVEFLMSECSREQFIALRTEYFSNPNTLAIEAGLVLSGKRKDGREFPVEISLSPLETEEGVLVVCGFRDISERKQLESQLIQSQKMESVGRLAAGIAHDFNNLLVVIKGQAIFLCEDLSNDEQLARAAKEIDEAADSAASLTHQLLVFSRQEVFQPKVLELNAVVSHASTLLQRLIGESIDLVIFLDPVLGRVKVDPGQIEQVIVNLAVNARDAMPQGGRLFIGTTNVELDDDSARQHIPVQPGSYVMLTVTDDGVGMDEEDIAHIFEPFFTTKEKNKGTGLGLATVYGIVTQSGGYIIVDSRPGQGTTFKVFLPRVELPLDTISLEPPEVPIRGGKETVLVVEDEKGVLRVERKILENYGYHTLVAVNATAALELGKSHDSPIHLLVTDVVMPTMSGRDLAVQLIRLRQDMKVLYVSGYTDDVIVHHGVLDPGIAFLYKPFTPETLARKVREVLDTD